MLAHLARDLRFASRSLARAPVFAAVAVLTLALGIGANAAIFSVLDATLLKTLPYADGDRLVLVSGRFTGIGLPNDLNAVSAPEFKDIEGGQRSFAAVAAVSSDSYNITVSTGPIHVQGAAVSPAFFDVLGVRPSLGRSFTPDQAQPGRDSAVVLSYGLWQRAFGGDPSVIERTIRVNGQPSVVVGVMPATFAYPNGAELWKPLAFTPEDVSANNRGNHGLDVIARVKSTLTIDQARADMQTLTASIIEANPQYHYRDVNYAVVLTTMAEDAVGDTRPTLYLLMGAVGLVLLIGCANVANLQLVRASARARELAVRSALGAGRGRIVGELLVESGLLAAVGGAVGLILAFWMMRALGPLAAGALPAHVRVTIDPLVLSFTAIVSLATVLVFGVVPAVQAGGVAPGDALKASPRTTAGPRSRRLRRALVAGEMALSLVLLAGAGLLGRSLMRLLEVDPGFRPEGVLTYRVSLPEEKYPGEEARRRFFHGALDRIRLVPGVQSVGAVNVLPLSGSNNSGTVTIDTTEVPLDRTTPEADWRPLLPGFFETMGVRLIAGRFFTDADNDRAAPVAIVDETFARTYWPQQGAIGKRVKIGDPQSPSPWRTVVGVVAHVRYRTLEAPSRAGLYWPAFQRAWPALTFVVRSTLEPSVLRAAVEREIQAIDPDQPVYAVRTMNEVMASSIARRQLAVALLAVFATIALVLAIVGVYGLTSYAIAERAQELGIRMALGAKPREVVASVVGDSLRLAVVGVVAGLVATAALAGLIQSMLFDTPPTDPFTLGAVSALLLATVLVASYAPARRVAQIDPAVTLRAE
jgi:predicted permease